MGLGEMGLRKKGEARLRIDACCLCNALDSRDYVLRLSRAVVVVQEHGGVVERREACPGEPGAGIGEGGGGSEALDGGKGGCVAVG